MDKLGYGQWLVFLLKTYFMVIFQAITTLQPTAQEANIQSH